MQINNVSAGYPDTSALGKGAELLDAITGKASKTAEQGVTATARSSTATAGQILARYNVRDISPASFSAMIQKLKEAKAISEAEFQDLAAIRQDLDAAGMDPNKSLDLVDFYSNRVQKLQRQTDDPQSQQLLAPTLRRLQWVQKFALMQSQPESVGISTVA